MLDLLVTLTSAVAASIGILQGLLSPHDAAALPPSRARPDPQAPRASMSGADRKVKMTVSDQHDDLCFGIAVTRPRFSRLGSPHNFRVFPAILRPGPVHNAAPSPPPRRARPARRRDVAGKRWRVSRVDVDELDLAESSHVRNFADRSSSRAAAHRHPEHERGIMWHPARRSQGGIPFATHHLFGFRLVKHALSGAHRGGGARVVVVLPPAPGRPPHNWFAVTSS